MSKAKALGGLGFRDIKIFNLVLIGKQLWKMMHNQDFLLIRIYKSSTMQNLIHLKLVCGLRLSYAWRSIHAAQKLIKQGARKLIGSGEETKVWQVQWIQKKPARKVHVSRWRQDVTNNGVPHDMRVK